ncbi:MAG: hypothetical protein ACI4XI_06900 [Ruminococcus sp.]
MGELTVKSHNFESAKKDIQKINKKISTDISLPSFRVNGGLFNAFSHKVTGDEMNDFVCSLEELLISSNERDKMFIDEFKSVYKAFESLDKDYIQSILVSIKSAEQANDEAKKAQAANNETLEKLKHTIRILTNFKTRIESIDHISDIDTMWTNLLCGREQLFDFIEKSDRAIAEINRSICELCQFTDTLKKYAHLCDIDTMWTSLLCENERLSDFIEKSDKTIAELNRSICELSQFTDTLKKYEHLSDIDTMWTSLLCEKDRLTEYTEKNERDIEKILENLSTLNQFKALLEGYEHLKDIDDEWEHSCDLDKKVINLEKVNEEQAQQIEILNEQLLCANDSLNSQKKQFRKNIIISYCIGASAFLFCLIHTILYLAGII